MIRQHFERLRFQTRPSPKRLTQVVERPGKLHPGVALTLLKLMARRDQPHLLFWGRSLSLALDRTQFSAAQGRHAGELFFEWFCSDGPTLDRHPQSLEEAYRLPSEPLQVGGRRRLWLVAIELARKLARAGAAAPPRSFGGFGGETCHVVFEHARDPNAFAQSMADGWRRGERRRWLMAASALPWDWLDAASRDLQPEPDEQEMLCWMAARVFAEGRLDPHAGAFWRRVAGCADLGQRRRSSFSASTNLWEAVDEPPALDRLVLDAATLWGWDGAFGVLNLGWPEAHAPSLSHRPCLDAQIQSAPWSQTLDKTIALLGEPEDLSQASPALRCEIERRILERDAAAAPTRQVLRI